MPYFRYFPLGLVISLLLGLLPLQARAQGNGPLLDRTLLSIGVGISDNEISNPDRDDTGFQFLGSYELAEVNLMEGVRSSVEFGLMDFGFDDDDTGIWGSFVVDGDISGGLGWLAQVGFDIGDDSGLLFGAGLKARLDDKADLRFEFVARDDVDSLQINFLYDL
jgi:hypothetical protein